MTDLLMPEVVIRGEQDLDPVSTCPGDCGDIDHYRRSSLAMTITERADIRAGRGYYFFDDADRGEDIGPGVTLREVRWVPGEGLEDQIGHPTYITKLLASYDPDTEFVILILENELGHCYRIDRGEPLA